MITNSYKVPLSEVDMLTINHDDFWHSIKEQKRVFEGWEMASFL